jgi:transcriptional regulator with XRE-family HTH domain
MFSFYESVIRFKPLGESDKKFAARLGVSRQLLSYWKQNDGFPTWPIVQHIATVLNVHPQKLLNDPNQIERRSNGRKV